MEIFDKLKAPFPPEKISWRVGASNKKAWEKDNSIQKKGIALAYIDARDVMERLDESAGIDVDYICAMSRRFSRKQKDGVVIIDHLGLLRGNPRLQKVHQIEEITTKLKSLSKTIKAPVLLLSQLSRAVVLCR